MAESYICADAGSSERRIHVPGKTIYIPSFLKTGFLYGVRFSERYKDKAGLLLMFHDDDLHDFQRCRHFTEKNGGGEIRESLLKKYGSGTPLFYNDAAMEELLDIAAGKKFDYGVMFNTKGELVGMKVFVNKSGNGKRSLEKRVIDFRGDCGTRHLAGMNAASKRRLCGRGSVVASQTEGTVTTFHEGDLVGECMHKPHRYVETI